MYLIDNLEFLHRINHLLIIFVITSKAIGATL